MQAIPTAPADDRYIVVGRRARGSCLTMGGRRFHVMLDDVGCALKISDEPARRDPLVAALFGAARAHKAF